MVISKAKKRHLSSNHLLLPPSMKDFASCFSEHALKVSDTSCSASSSGGNSSVIDNAAPVLAAVTCVYRARLLTQKELLIRVAWSKRKECHALSVAVDDIPWQANAMSSQLLRKKGSRTFICRNFNVGLHWDISSATYGAGPEPTDGFYVAVVVNSEFALLLGDLSDDYRRRSEESTLPVAECSMICRREQVVGDAPHTTRARFHDGEGDHEITVRFRADGWDRVRDSELSVSVDGKRVVQVRSLRWNFRGNHTIFIDGSPVDMTWDMHDWWFGGGAAAVFMFRARSTLESRLWLEEEALQQPPRFSLLIQAFRSQ
ncbi:hypothetical protein Cni_G06009 [Canna indica]|uniref:Uncharacterized protein n=1 Tax=Canna indica TaxID=4628 RepID=A0AAQ3JYW7_9LILI|nr:hypothetical protein Cni_G06009 [Canna indica]